MNKVRFLSVIAVGWYRAKLFSFSQPKFQKQQQGQDVFREAGLDLTSPHYEFFVEKK